MAGEPIEKQLWCSVIQLALDDYYTPMPVRKSKGKPPRSWRQRINEWQKAHHDARLFLTKVAGEWARSRADVCAAAGIDPDALREAVLRQDARLQADAA